ncbi:MAG: glycosyltransferase family 1 protein [Prevotella sp.]|nr:glycosyltransferase family 1 protein [Prevotella sp.]
MRILLIGEYSNLHATLAEGLRQLGHEVNVLSNGDFWKDYPRDIALDRTPGKFGGIKYLIRLLTLLPRLRHYDVVQFINPMFLEIKANRIFPIYKYLKRHNKKVFLGAFGMDYYWVNTCCKDKPLRYSDFNIGDALRNDEDAIKERKDWLGTDKERLNKYIADNCDGIIAGLYEYWVCYHSSYPQKTTYIPFPIRMHDKVVLSQHDKLKLFIGINKSRNSYKGTDIMLRAAEKIQRMYPDKLEIIKVESVPFKVYQQLMNDCDAILDQLYSYTPAMNALLAMSKGIICIGGGEEECYQLLDEKTLRPIVNVLPNQKSVEEAIERLVLHPEIISQLKSDSIAFIKKHHDYVKVAKQYLKLYKK